MLAIGTERFGGEGTVRAVELIEGATVPWRLNRVGVGGTLPATLRVEGALFNTSGRRGIAIGKRPGSATGGALCMTGASGSEGPEPRGLMRISAGFFLRLPGWAARRRAKLIGGGGKEWATVAGLEVDSVVVRVEESINGGGVRGRAEEGVGWLPDATALPAQRFTTDIVVGLIRPIRASFEVDS